MPTYNRAKYILETIESIRNQTYKNWELVIVDDGSDDNTEELIMHLKDSRIKFLKAGRKGIVGKIKNIGLQHATGEMVAFIDSDDLWAPSKLEKQVASLAKNPDAGFCLTGGYNFKNPGEPMEYFYKQKEGSRYGNLFLSFFQSEVSGFTQALLLHKKCLVKTGYFNEEKTFSDIEFILNLADQFNGVILYEPLVFRRLHDDNDSHVHWEKRVFTGIEIINTYSKKLPWKVARDAFFRIYIHFGEKYLQNRKRKKAIGKFLMAWKYRPFSVIPFKKIGKAIFQYFKKPGQ